MCFTAGLGGESQWKVAPSGRGFLFAGSHSCKALSGSKHLVVSRSVLPPTSPAVQREKSEIHEPLCLCQAMNTRVTGIRRRENTPRAGFVPLRALWHHQLLQRDPTISSQQCQLGAAIITLQVELLMSVRLNNSEFGSPVPAPNPSQANGAGAVWRDPEAAPALFPCDKPKNNK